MRERIRPNDGMRPRELDFGVGLFPTEAGPAIVGLAALAEGLGYASVWFGDSHLIWREPYVLMGAAAARTSHVRIGTGVTNPVTRHPMMVASAFYTLDELAGGRAAVGIGVGDSSVRTMGLRPAGLVRLEQVVGAVRGLLRGADVEIDGARGHLAAARRAPREIPIYVAGGGPRTLEMAGRIADGAIVSVGTAPEDVRAAVDGVGRGAAAAGRDPSSLRLVAWCSCALSTDASAVQAVKTHVARKLLRTLPADLGPEAAEVASRIRARYDFYRHMEVGAEHAQMVPDDLVRRFALAGRPEDVAGQLDRLAGTGVHEVAIIPYPTPEFDRDATIRVFAERVIPRLRP